MCPSTPSSAEAGLKAVCKHMRSAGHKIKETSKKAGRRLRTKLAKHGLLGANFKADYELSELGRKYWTRPAHIDEYTYRHAERTWDSTWWHNCDRKDDSCRIALAQMYGRSPSQIERKEQAKQEFIDKYFRLKSKKARESTKS